MAKDPAFLFYSKDFYEGTRLMLPEERACFIDLMIYQHQHGGFIPNDIKRMTMYCSGIDKATLEATLEAKFKLCDKGWYNEKLEKVINDRQEFSIKQSGNGLLGQFFKKAKTTINTSDYDKLKSYIFNEYGKEKLIEELKKDTNTYEAMLEALLKHLANVNVNVIGNKDNKGGEKFFLHPTEKIELKTKIDKFIEWFNQMRIYYKLSGNIRFLEDEEVQNLLFLQENYSNDEFVKAFEMMMKEDWAKEAKQVLPKHFLKPYNFTKYINS